MERTNRKPPNKQYRISAFRRIQPKATHGPSQPFGTSDIQGMAKGRRRTPDSPESAGFFDATKNSQAKTAAADNRNNPAASAPPRENLSAGFIVLPNRSRLTGSILFFQASSSIWWWEFCGAPASSRIFWTTLANSGLKKSRLFSKLRRPPMEPTIPRIVFSMLDQ